MLVFSQIPTFDCGNDLRWAEYALPMFTSERQVTMPRHDFAAVNIDKQMTIYLRSVDTASLIKAQPPWWR
jgi:hypothetical protein